MSTPKLPRANATVMTAKMQRWLSIHYKISPCLCLAFSTAFSTELDASLRFKPASQGKSLLVLGLIAGGTPPARFSSARRVRLKKLEIDEVGVRPHVWLRDGTGTHGWRRPGQHA
jgi:hypothetical protein